MKCPNCGSTKLRVIDSRPHEELDAVRRCRVCDNCGTRITTYEVIAEHRYKKYRVGEVGLWHKYTKKQKPAESGAYIVNAKHRESMSKRAKYTDKILIAYYDKDCDNWICEDSVQAWTRIPQYTG